MRGTREHRVKHALRLGLAAGLSEQEALARAYAAEGVPPPAPERDLAEEIEQLHFKLHCTERQCAAATARAAKLLRENRALKERLARKTPEGAGPFLILAQAGIFQGLYLSHCRDGEPGWTGDAARADYYDADDADAVHDQVWTSENRATIVAREAAMLPAVRPRSV